MGGLPNYKVKATLTYIWRGYSFDVLYIIQNTPLLLIMDSHDIHYTSYHWGNIHVFDQIKSWFADFLTPPPL